MGTGIPVPNLQFTIQSMIASIAIELLSCFDKLMLRQAQHEEQGEFLILSLSKDEGAIRFEAIRL